MREIRGGRAFGGQRRGRRLDDPPGLEQACDQRFVAPHVGMPGEHPISQGNYKASRVNRSERSFALPTPSVKVATL